MQIGSDSQASNGQYVFTNTKGQGILKVSVNIQIAGTYYLWGRVIADTTSTDSFYVSIDSSTEDIWDVLQAQPQPSWTWDRVSRRGSGTFDNAENDPWAFSLSAGLHTFKFRGRDKNTKLDKLILTNDINFSPTPSPTPTPTPSPTPTPVPNQPPTLNLEANPTSGTTPLTVTFNSNASDPDGSIVEYRWDFDGNGTVDKITTSNPVSFTYANAGTYNATVKVIDNGSSSASDSVTVNVSPPAGGSSVQPPTFYISPSGSDSNSGTSTSSPWKTFAYAIPRLQPGDMLVLMNGTYKGTNSGYPDINCNTNAVNGTATKPITIKAQNERQAFLQGDGSGRPFIMRACSYWNIEGLRAQNGDFPNEGSGTGAGSVFVVTGSSNITMKRLLGTKNNRYKNSHIYIVNDSSDILIEESEAYYFHRHGFSIFQSSFVTLRRNYANSRGYADIAGGNTSGHTTRGDEGLTFYLSDDSIMENNISEGNERFGNKGSRNLVLGNIALNEHNGFGVGHHCCVDSPTKDNTYINNVIVNSVNQGFHLQSDVNTLIENMTVIDSGSNGFVANNEVSNNNDPSKPWTVVPSLTMRNSLSLNNSKDGFEIDHVSDFSFIVLQYLNAFGNSTNYGSGTETRTNSKTIDPVLGNCKVYIPAGSPMKGVGRNGADIGANIIYRYENGVLTDKKLWDQTTGRFPCGAIVTGVNDNSTFPDSACVNVHKRLNVGVNGCAIP